MCERLLPQRSDDALGRGAEQEHLSIVRDGLHREHAEQREGDAV